VQHNVVKNLYQLLDLPGMCSILIFGSLFLDVNHI
jgi:hypothetical protein